MSEIQYLTQAASNLCAPATSRTLMLDKRNSVTVSVHKRQNTIIQSLFFQIQYTSWSTTKRKKTDNENEIELRTKEYFDLCLKF